MDEQHSRSQRKFGSAPYCTATFLNKDSLVFQMVNVDQDAVESSSVTTKAGTAAKSKAKVSHCLAMQGVVDYFQGTETSLRHFCTDQSSDGCSDGELYFRSVWPDYHSNYDIWHKVKEFDQLWKAYCCEREYPRGNAILAHLLVDWISYGIGPFKRKELQYLFSTEKLLSYAFKIHFEYCCSTCTGTTTAERVDSWRRDWLNASWYYQMKWNEGWMNSYIDDCNRMLISCCSLMS